MPVTAHVPPSLTQGPFTVQRARDDGVTSRMLQGAQWVRLTHGVHCHRSVTVDDAVRLEAVKLALPPDAVVTGKLAAWAHGVWTPPPGQPLPLTFALERGHARPRENLDGSHRLVVPSADVVEVDGLRCTSPMRTAFQLMRGAPLVEAVVVADAFAFAGTVELPWLWAYVDSHRRWPGVNHSRLALKLSSSRARSPGETRIRMVAVLGGLPEPYVNMPLYRGDELVALLDLYLVGRRDRVVGVEYDGAYHEESLQRHDDNRRENRISVESHIPVLRYDRYTVARHRERSAALHQMARTIGVEPLSKLKAVSFAGPRRPFRW